MANKQKLITYPEELRTKIADLKKEWIIRSDSAVFVRAIIDFHKNTFKKIK